MFTHVQVEPNDNCEMSTFLVYKNVTEPVAISGVRLYEGAPEPTLYAITGWSSDGGGTATPAYSVQVEDSGSGVVWLVYGGDWGIRLRPADSMEDWGLGRPGQWGETHLVLAEREDIFP